MEIIIGLILIGLVAYFVFFRNKEEAVAEVVAEEAAAEAPVEEVVAEVPAEEAEKTEEA